MYSGSGMSWSCAKRYEPQAIRILNHHEKTPNQYELKRTHATGVRFSSYELVVNFFIPGNKEFAAMLYALCVLCGVKGSECGI